MKLLKILLFGLGAISVNGQAWKGELHSDLVALEKQAKEGDPAAMADFAFHSMRCMGGLRYEPNRIFDYFSRSAAAGNTEGKVGLAHCYCFSVGTLQDVRKAEQLIAEPLQENHPVAEKIMGYFFYGKQGVKERDLAKVAEWNAKSAAQGCVAARYNIAIGYTFGRPELDVERGMKELLEMHEDRIFPLASGFLLECLRKHQVWDNQDEIAQSCVQKISQYAKLNEPYALYRLGRFHQDASDFENAVAHYAKSAQLGKGDSYLALFALVQAEGRRNRGNIWMRSRDRGNLALQAYKRGAWNSYSLSYAGWEITRMLNSNQSVLKQFPNFENDAIHSLPEMRSLHDCLGRLYLRAKPGANPRFAKPEWGKAHLIYHSNRSRDASASLSAAYFDSENTAENLARGYVCSLHAGRKGHSRHQTQKHRDWMEKQMTPEAHKRAKELEEEGFPEADKFREQARELLVKIGHLKTK